jgi:hypothetical protein
LQAIPERRLPGRARCVNWTVAMRPSGCQFHAPEQEPCQRPVFAALTDARSPSASLRWKASSRGCRPVRDRNRRCSFRATPVVETCIGLKSRIQSENSVQRAACETPANVLIRNVRQSREIALNVLSRPIVGVCILPDPEKLAPGLGCCCLVSHRAFCASQTQQGFGSLWSAFE